MTARRERKLSKKQKESCTFTDDKIEAMKKKAQELSKMIAQKSKTVDQPLTQSETSSISEHSFNIDVISSQKNTDLRQNNDELFPLKKNANTSDLCCTSGFLENSLPETTASTLNHSTPSKKTKDLRTKIKNSDIPFLVKCDNYQDEHVDSLTSKKQDDYVLEKLFNKSGKL